MTIGETLSDVVVFELPTSEDAEAFAERVARWPVWRRGDGTVCFVAVDLVGVPDDLPELLGSGRALVAELGLGAIVFHLDGRGYLLESAAAPTVTAPLR